VLNQKRSTQENIGRHLSKTGATRPRNRRVQRDPANRVLEEGVGACLTHEQVARQQRRSGKAKGTEEQANGIKGRHYRQEGADPDG